MGLGAARRAWVVVLAITTACTDSADEFGSEQEPLTPVTWTNVVGVSAVGSSLTKTDPATGWNAGASSVESLVGDGFVEFTTGENTTDKMAGLGSGDAGQGYADIEFAIRLNDLGRVAVFESGTRVFLGGSYAAGDRFRVRVLDGVVSYWQNGRLLHTSAVVASFPLVVDTSLRTPGATVTEVASENLVFWRGLIRVRAVANDLVKTDSSDTWNAGALSVATVSRDGYVQFTTRENTTNKAAGLSHGNSNPGRGDIDFAIALRSNGQYQVYESNVLRGTFGRYVPGDVFRVEVSGGLVTYWRNTAAFYTSTVAPSFPLLLDTSLRTPGATIEDAQIVAGPIDDPICTAHSQLLAGDALPVADVREFGSRLDMAGDILVAADAYSAPQFVAVYRESGGDYQLEQVLSGNNGRMVATDGQTIAAGTGGATLFRHDGVQWTSEGTVSGCVGDFSSYFGESAAVQGALMVAGMHWSSTAPAGRAYVYRRNTNRWALEAILTPDDGVQYDYFGNAVAIGGDRIFIGAPRKSGSAQLAGAVYVYRYDPGAPAGNATCDAPTAGRWKLETILHQASPEAWDFFGYSAIEANASGTEIAVGNVQFGPTGPGGGANPNGPGKAHVFAFDGFTWNETAVLTPASPDPACLDNVRCEFAAFLAWGGPDPDAPSILLMGPNYNAPDTTYVFERLSGAWVQTGTLTEPDALPYTSFGRPVGIGASSVAIGAAGWDDGGGGGANIGAVHVYDLLTCPAP